MALPNLTLVAYAPLTAPALLALDTCAERQALETTARYTLTRAAFARAGWGADATAERLHALTGAALPQNVRATLADWERHVERLRLTRDARVLTVEDAAVLDALLRIAPRRHGCGGASRRLSRCWRTTPCWACAPGCCGGAICPATSG